MNREKRLTPRQWQVINQLAAELVLEHSMDVSLLYQTVQYITTYRPNNESLLAWIEGRMDAARYFARSQQTLPQNATLKAIVLYLQEMFDISEVKLATMLGWMARLMVYYDLSRNEARSLVDPLRLKLEVTVPTIVAMQSRPARRVVTPPVASAGEADRISEEAEKFMELFRKKKQGK